jgi:hypothetical protein
MAAVVFMVALMWDLLFEFAVVSCTSFCWYCVYAVIIKLILLSVPTYWIGRIFYNFDAPLSDGNLTHIDFPLPPLVPSAPCEPLPVTMMVGSCSEAKRCAYCHEEFDCNSARRFCFACKSATHEECAILNANCSVFGCSGTTQLRNA